MLRFRLLVGLCATLLAGVPLYCASKPLVVTPRPAAGQTGDWELGPELPLPSLIIELPRAPPTLHREPAPPPPEPLGAPPLVSPAAVHSPQHVTSLPPEVEQAQQRARHECSRPADCGGESSQPAPQPPAAQVGATSSVARQVLAGLALDTGPAAAAVRAASHAAMQQLQAQEEGARKLYARAVAAAQAQHQAARAAQERLDGLALARSDARGDADLARAEALEQQLEAQWELVAELRAQELVALSDVDALAHTISLLQAAQAHEQVELSLGLRDLSLAAAAGAAALQAQAQDLMAAAHAGVVQEQALLQQAVAGGRSLGLRDRVAESATRALAVLRAVGHRLQDSRVRYQQLWRSDLVLAHQASLLSALTREARQQLQDLQWMQDMALAADVYPEAAAAQAVARKLATMSPGAYESVTATANKKDDEGRMSGVMSAGSAMDAVEVSVEAAAQQRELLLEELQVIQRLHGAQRQALQLLDSLGELSTDLASGKVDVPKALAELQSARAALIECETQLAR